MFYIQSVHYKMLTLCVSVWQVLELVQRLLQEDKMATQREAYYCLVNHFKDQAEFNSTLQGNAQCSMTSSYTCALIGVSNLITSSWLLYTYSWISKCCEHEN